jgi:ubiquinone/menaquinone biosynthesis C-methylase UbiE
MNTKVPSAWHSERLTPGEVPAVVSAMQAYYEERAGQYDDWYRHINLYADPEHDAAWQAEMAQMTEWVRGFGRGRLLEIAAGTGWWTRYLARNAQVTTLDYAPAMIEALRARLRAEGAGAHLTRGDAYHLPFAAASFECCFFGFWLSHVPFELLGLFLAEVRRVVRPRGAVLLVDSKPFRGEAPAVELKQERRLNDGSRHQIVKVYHTPETLRRLLESFGQHAETWTSGTFFTAGRYVME